MEESAAFHTSLACFSQNLPPTDIDYASVSLQQLELNQFQGNKNSDDLGGVSVWALGEGTRALRALMKVGLGLSIQTDGRRDPTEWS